MSYLRLVGLLISLAVLLYVWWQRHRRHYRRGEFLLGILVASGLGAVSLFPPIVNGLTQLFRVPTRLMALAILGNIVLFLLVLYVLRELSSVRDSMGDLVRALARAEYHAASREKAQQDIAVIMPAFNEEKGLEKLLPSLPSQVCGQSLRALVIVDGAQDQSAAVARHYAVPVTSHVVNRGQGDALRTGFELALQDGVDIVMTMDADGQHRPDEIERLVAPILAGEADFVMGTRFLGHYDDRGSKRHVGILGFSALISLLSGVRITDCTNGFRAIRASALTQLELRENRFSAPELIMEAVGKGLRIKEVPVSILSRYEGESKKPRSWRYPLGFALVILRTWLRS